MPRDRLTDRQQRFVEEYLCDLNATQAAIRAGFSPATASEQGARLLANVNVRAAIDRAKAERSRRTGIHADLVLEELALLARSDLSDFVTWGPEGVLLKPGPSLPPVLRRAVVEVHQRETKWGTNISVKLHDKVAALKLLGQHLGLFDENGRGAGATVNININVQEIIREEVQRVMAGAPRSLDEINQRFPLPPPPAH